MSELEKPQDQEQKQEQDIKPFNMNDWKFTFTNDNSDVSSNYLNQYKDNISLVFVTGTYIDKLPSIDFMKTNLIKGFFQSFDNKLTRNAFGTAILLPNNALHFTFMFYIKDNKDDRLPELFEKSDLFESCFWSNIKFDDFVSFIYPKSYPQKFGENFTFLVYK